MGCQTKVLSTTTIKPSIRWLLLSTLVMLQWSCAGGRQAPAPVVNVYVKSADKPGIQYKSLRAHSYTVSKGDTLYSIAWRAGLDFRRLAKLNSIYSPYQIFPGQIIRLRSNAPKPMKTKAPKDVVKTEPVISPTNVAKTLATPKQREYGQDKQQQKTSSKSADADKNKRKKSLQSQSKNKPFSNKIRKWVWPSNGEIIATFSYTENGNKGIDIGGKDGASVVSAADGKVVYYGNALRGYGNLVIIKHNDDYLSAYAHNRKVLVKEMDFVKAGQPIAEMGDSDSDKVKLHFEVRYRGKSVNPMKYLPKR